MTGTVFSWAKGFRLGRGAALFAYDWISAHPTRESPVNQKEAMERMWNK
jgi:radical SAM superfamily enzyme with C-terminal helix-hairpin-helix motif